MPLVPSVAAAVPLSEDEDGAGDDGVGYDYDDYIEGIDELDP